MSQRPHFSHSSLRQLQTCALQFRLQRIDKLPRQHRSPALILGSCYHASVAEALNASRRGNDVTVDFLVEKFQAAWNAELSIEDPPVRWTRKVTADGQLELGLRLVEAWFEQAMPVFAQAQILAVEEPFTLPIISSGGEVLETPLEGVIDVIIQLDDEVVVIDHKTSSNGSVGDLFVDLDMQATAYTYAAHHLGFHDARFAFHTMSKTKTPKFTVVEAPRDPADWDRLYWVASQAEKLMATGLYLPTAPGWQCEACEYAYACRHAHQQPAEALAVAV
jgi:CRISPR/Cas system-associated exonuclease Cas4 (RecB family)